MAMFPSSRLRALLRNRCGATAVEFALAIPACLMLIIGFIQVGTLFFANAGLQHAVGEGARMATLWPRRTESEIAARISGADFGLHPDGLESPTFVYGTESGQDFVEITVTYNADLSFLFFEIEDIELTHSRRAYMP